VDTLVSAVSAIATVRDGGSNCRRFNTPVAAGPSLPPGAFRNIRQSSEWPTHASNLELKIILMEKMGKSWRKWSFFWFSHYLQRE
jgi:hypothetical protein